MIRRYLGVALVLTAFATGSAWAGNFYAGVFAGLNDTGETDFDVDLGNIETDFDAGAAYGVALGYQFSAIRLEAELTRREGDVDSHELDGTALSGAVGELNSTALMGNVYYDFRRNKMVRPFVGAGVGYITTDYTDFGVEAIPDVLDDDDDVLGYQVQVGLHVKLTDNLLLRLDVRRFETDDSEVVTSTDTGTTATDATYEATNFNVGLTFRF